MAPIQEKVQKVSFKKLHYAKMLDENAETYETVIKTLDKPISLGIEKNYSDASFDAGDRVVAQENQLDSMTLTGEMADLPTEVRADWFGHEISDEGGLIEKVTDEAPYVALGLESEDQLVWIYKTKLKPSEETFNTKKKGEAGFKSASFTGEAIPLSDGLIRYPIRLSDAGVTETAATFFTEVKKPTVTPTP